MNMKLVGTFEIAEIAAVSPQAVSNWVARKVDFPHPLVTLRSGPVWDETVVRKWLKAAGLLPTHIERDMTVDDFVEGATYSLSQIRDVLGGETMPYLPQVGKDIVCGRFMRAMNPGAPYEVLVGNPKRVQAKAHLLAAQGGSLPLFVKEIKGSTSWTYHGRFDFVRYSSDPKEYGPKARAAGRDDVVGILFFAK